MKNIKEELMEKFKDFKVGINGEDYMKRCAVLIPIVKINGEYNVIFEVRNNKLNSNPGEICFPGGSIDLGESPREAALRECFEEIGIREEEVDLIGELDMYISTNNILIYPFLGVIKESEEELLDRIKLNTDEVWNILTVPLEYLKSYKPEVVYSKVLNIPSDDFPFENVIGGKDYKFREGKYRVVFYKYGDSVIWGMTARILENFLEFLK